MTKTTNIGLNTNGPLGFTAPNPVTDGAIAWDSDANMQIIDGLLPIQVRTRITAAQLLSIGSSPVVLVPAPGPLKVLMPLYAVVRYRFGGVAFGASFAAQLQISISGVSGSNGITILEGGLLDQTVDKMITLWATNMIAMNPSAYENQPLELLENSGHSLSNGNGSLDINLAYIVMATQ